MTTKKKTKAQISVDQVTLVEWKQQVDFLARQVVVLKTAYELHLPKNPNTRILSLLQQVAEDLMSVNSLINIDIMRLDLLVMVPDEKVPEHLREWVMKIKKENEERRVPDPV